MGAARSPCENGVGCWQFAICDCDSRLAIYCRREASRATRHPARRPVGREELAHLGDAAVGQQRHAPDAVAPRHREIEHLAVRRQGHAVRAGHVRQEQVELAARAQAVEPARRVVKPALPLVREVDVALRVEHQVVHALEALGVAPLQVRRDTPGPHVHPHQAVLVVGDEQGSGVDELHAVGFAVVLGHLRPCARRIDTEDAAEGNVRHVEVARVVEHRPFEERVGRRPAAVGVGPDTPLRPPQRRGHCGEGLQFEHLGRLQKVHGGLLVSRCRGVRCAQARLDHAVANP